MIGGASISTTERGRQRRSGCWRGMTASPASIMFPDELVMTVRRVIEPSIIQALIDAGDKTIGKRATVTRIPELGVTR